jgi:hypothetical protein
MAHHSCRAACCFTNHSTIEASPTTFTRPQHRLQRLRVGQPVIVADLDQRRRRQSAVPEKFLAVGKRHHIVGPAVQDHRAGLHGTCGSRKPRRPAGSKQQGPVVVYGNEPTRRGRSDGAIRRPGGRLTPHPCRSRKPRRQAGSTQQGPVVMYRNEPTRRGCSDGAIRRPGGRPLPGSRAGVARAGGRSSGRTRCGCGDKHSFGPRRRAVKRLNGSMAKVPQAPSAWAFGVGLSNLTLREFVSREKSAEPSPAAARIAPREAALPSP